MPPSKKPNFLLIIADDLGFSDPFGNDINTPNLDKLAKNGLTLTDFHTASACSPTRSMLLSGNDNHLAGLGQMAEFARNYPSIWKDEEGTAKPGYEGVLNYRVAALPEILNQPDPQTGKGVYRTLLSGKWHLGLTEPFLPSNRGFERSWGLLPGAGNHFKYNPDVALGVPATKTLWSDNGNLFSMDDLPDSFYSTDAFTDKLIEYLDEDYERPFFAMLTLTAPHWPLQAPRHLIEKYKGRFDEGPHELRKERLLQLHKLGLISDNALARAHPIIDTYGKGTWDRFTEDEKKRSARTMEVYAAMVESIDENVGRLLKHLEDKEELENTFVVFMSDNGAEGSLLEALPILGERIQESIEKAFDNSFENIGNGNSYVWYGPEWAQAATAPSQLYKAFTYEGGIRVPFILNYPQGHPSLQGGAVSHEFTTVMDLAPTILDLAGIEHPGTEFQGRQIYPIRGKSWSEWLHNAEVPPHNENTITGWELFGQQAIRKGHWKALYVPAPAGSDEWELYNLKEDTGEVTNLAKTEPEILKDLIAHWSVYEAETGMVLPPPKAFADHKGYIPVLTK
ncbi:hypothetical protein E3Q23_04309 [Wallemia mellicola]|nr:hypothetical protein E3Q23_04309 [Wallemia mellicola]TIC11386.1 alkaline phosphatase-like protein [Wallemia mellicola]